MTLSNGNPRNALGWTARFSLKGPLGVSLLALAVAALVVLVGATSLVTSAFGFGVGGKDPKKEIEQLVAKHDDAMKTWQKRFNGRSAFFKPPAPPQERPKIVEPPKEEPPPNPGPPPIDPVYRGPSIAFAYGDTVYFSPTSTSEKFLLVRVGQEKSGVKVLATNLPWSVKVGFKGGEYDVTAGFNLGEQSPFLSSTPKPALLTSFLMPAPNEIAPPAAAAPADGTAAAMAAGQAGEAPQPDPPPQRRRPPRGAPRDKPDAPQAEEGGDPVIEAEGEVAGEEEDEAVEVEPSPDGEGPVEEPAPENPPEETEGEEQPETPPAPEPPPPPSVPPVEEKPKADTVALHDAAWRANIGLV